MFHLKPNGVRKYGVPEDSQSLLVVYVCIDSPVSATCLKLVCPPPDGSFRSRECRKRLPVCFVSVLAEYFSEVGFDSE